MENTSRKNVRKKRMNTLRTFVTLAVIVIVALSLVCAGGFFYTKSAKILTKNYEKDIWRRLSQVNKQVEDQIHILNTVFPLFLSNSTIRENLEPYQSSNRIKRKLAIEKQISYLLVNTVPWNEKYMNGVYIFDKEEACFRVSLISENPEKWENVKEVYKETTADTRLQIRTLRDKSDSIYFVRNIYSTYTGEKIAVMVLDINQKEWIAAYSADMDKDWIVYLFSEDMRVINNKEMESFSEKITTSMLNGTNGKYLKTVSIEKTEFYLASRTLEGGDIVSIVAAPRAQLMKELNKTLKTFITLFIVIVFITLVCALILSRFITAPIEKMIVYVKGVSKGNTAAEPPVGLYSEFDDLAEAFLSMLKQLDIYYFDSYQKKLLLNNAELKALQSQMDPHFLFNILDTIAWKAQINGSEEIYQMIISLGELLRANTLSKEKDFVTLKEELSYVKFYLYLQQNRFEDKFTTEIQCDPALEEIQIPRFSIQPLVENAIVHGLEARKDNGHLYIHVLKNNTGIEIAVIDNGMGFVKPVDIKDIQSSDTDKHTHIGLKNLNKRLILLYGETSGIQIDSVPKRCTTVSFVIPNEREGE